MGKRCRLEVSGVEQGFGLAVFEFDHTTAEVCFAWRRLGPEVELVETDESKRYCRFLDDWQSAFWRSDGIRRLLRRRVRQVAQPT